MARASSRSRKRRSVPPVYAALGKLLLSSHPLRNDQTDNARRRLLADFVKLLGGLPLAEKKLPVARIVESRTTPAPLPTHLPTQPFVPHLSPRRSQILNLLLLGHSEKQVARALTLSIHTVHVHIKSVYKKFDVNTRAELLAHFLRHGRV